MVRMCPFRTLWRSAVSGLLLHICPDLPFDLLVRVTLSTQHIHTSTYLHIYTAYLNMSGPLFDIDERRLVDQNIVSWNPLLVWLRQGDRLPNRTIVRRTQGRVCSAGSTTWGSLGPSSRLLGEHRARWRTCDGGPDSCTRAGTLQGCRLSTRHSARRVSAGHGARRALAYGALGERFAAPGPARHRRRVILCRRRRDSSGWW